MQPPKQWPGRDMYKVSKRTIKTCFYNVNFDLLQIKSTPILLGLPSPAAILLNRMVRVLLPRINRSPLICEYNKIITIH